MAAFRPSTKRKTTSCAFSKRGSVFREPFVFRPTPTPSRRKFAEPTSPIGLKALQPNKEYSRPPPPNRGLHRAVTELRRRFAPPRHRSRDRRRPRSTPDLHRALAPHRESVSVWACGTHTRPRGNAGTRRIRRRGRAVLPRDD